MVFTFNKKVSMILDFDHGHKVKGQVSKSFQFVENMNNGPN